MLGKAEDAGPPVVEMLGEEAVGVVITIIQVIEVLEDAVGAPPQNIDRWTAQYMKTYPGTL